MKDPSSASCPHCGRDVVSQDALDAQQRIQELETQLKLYSQKAAETGLYFSLEIPRGALLGGGVSDLVTK